MFVCIVVQPDDYISELDNIIGLFAPAFVGGVLLLLLPTGRSVISAAVGSVALAASLVSFWWLVWAAGAPRHAIPVYIALGLAGIPAGVATTLLARRVLRGRVTVGAYGVVRALWLVAFLVGLVGASVALPQGLARNGEAVWFVGLTSVIAYIASAVLIVRAGLLDHLATRVYETDLQD